MNIQKPNVSWNGNPSPLETVEKIVLHHMAHPSWGFTDVHEFHRDDNGWFGIGYNYWVSFEGDVYEGRGKNQGAHTRGLNDKSIGIGFQGNFDEQNMPEAQFKAGAQLTAKFVEEYNLSVEDVIGHGDAGNTACPGANFPMSRMKEEVEKILSGGKFPEITAEIGIVIDGEDTDVKGYLINNRTHVPALVLEDLEAAEVSGHGDHITIEVKSDKGKDKKDKAEIKKIIKALRKLVGKE